MKTSEKYQVLQFIKSRYPNFVSGLEIERWAVMDFKMKAETAGRRARELVRENYVERELNENRNVKYRYISREERQKVEMSEQELLRFATG